MKHEAPKSGRPGETSQWPRWEGPAESRPSGYMQGETNIFAEGDEQQKHRGVAPAGYDRSDEDVKAAVNEALTQDAMLDPTAIIVGVREGKVTLEGSVTKEADRRRAEECALSVHGVNSCENNIRVASA
ncbi:osmotically-inducible protein OsmY [Pseudorhizobium tarimense]|uniref:Osmotically-inducible protein OsmY n=1 Tax=Pseudorhizobium tarimense TaxID=1079109 RepID=A0ABV2H966_9HYPH|nr:BON domain-containing protein [Pseudorhizobium tarimense]MCJ8520151.1 BON domain-containing protein [Pseudorhizobium tarimense]